ncbi:BREX-1 system adenine-specific DNA-methyltransferase PglX [Kamptonema sp. UHCC 0994]|uniref:BREX-1 system adenine-specific DNA-methyltransferase PglX n=1 Tax=Kamptonema sp. UHCC 0994 TaxID=3031329 RepID=UPI0023B91863|nr:BREX-1 system adenine-specific DNA-methyltransferase PglX [Kamptonema sp. UHCC 0994]MDF0553364.1 BREX-1 system adenine-specific DNA-methyltransferase PglX [Kamptonema sp. UHCC 0994]
MNRNSVKTLAIWARRHLREQVTARAALYGITAKQLVEPTTVSGGLLVAGQTLDAREAKQYELLRQHLKELMQKGKLAEAVETLIDEIAYTWFNRLIALRYMEVNGYIGRVLSSSDSMFVDPDILREASEIAELEKLPALNLEVLSQWRSLASREPNSDEFLYRRLLLCQCEALADSLPFLFDRSQNYMALFMPGNLLNQDSILRRLVSDISEEDWLAKKPDEEDQQDVEIIGWLYQFYISEKKDEVIGAKSKVKAQDIPAATQLFTPHWIVRYMVENSLGRLWLESHPESKLRDYMPYYLENPNQEGEKEGFKPLQPEDLTVCDPACGSGHILVYAFTLLFLIYREQGYLERDIPELILTHNLYGLDIDERAVQLASFAVLMKARAINSRIFRKSLSLNLTAVRGTNSQSLPLASELDAKDWQGLIEAFKDADNLGSLIVPPSFDGEKLKRQLAALEASDSLFKGFVPALRGLVLQAELLRKQYWVVVANPPYIGGRSLNDTIKLFLEKNYSDTKSDVFAAFIERCLLLCSINGGVGLITPYVWMFILSHEKLRAKIVKQYTLTTLVQLEYNSFPSVTTPVCTFTLLKKYHKAYVGDYINLSQFKGWEIQEIKTLEAVSNKDCPWRYQIQPDNFKKIPSQIIAYWVKKDIINIFQSEILLEKIASPMQGLATADNTRFLRNWFEVFYSNIGFSLNSREEAKLSQKSWFPHIKGGEFRRWYGNLDWVINWKNDGMELFAFKPKSVIRNPNYYFTPGISWTEVTIASPSFRKFPKGFIFDQTGPLLTLKQNSSSIQDLSLLGLLNSHVSSYFFKFLAPTMHVTCGQVSKFPIVKISPKYTLTIIKISQDSIDLSKQDWDNFETSWDFQIHPLLRYNTPQLSEAFKNWQFDSENAFQQLKHLEEENNKYWIEAYGLQDELTPEVPDDQITIRRADQNRDIRSLISYAVGCMMGRYSLDQPGLIHAGQPFDPTQHSIFPADIDAIIPITDQAYFDDDIVNRFVEFIRVAYSPETLTENLDFIADTLTRRSGETSRDRIRRYFLTEFISDHIQTYKKRPIYWLFTSGKNRAFNALVYLHRYSPDTLARLRTDYVLEQQVKLDGEISRTQQQFDNATNSAAKKAATKRLKELQTQQLELRDYQAKLQTMADARIKLDLDDGVAYNYTRFKGLVYEGSDLKMADLEKAAQWKLELLKVDG